MKLAVDTKPMARKNRSLATKTEEHSTVAAKELSGSETHRPVRSVEDSAQCDTEYVTPSLAMRNW